MHMATVLIAGGSGLVGKRLATLLVEQGYTVHLLSRTGKVVAPYKKAFAWDIDKSIFDDEALTVCDAIINLAGEGIADKPWTSERKRAIVDSRVKSTQLLFERVKRIPNKVKTYVSASATGYYGAISATKEFSETDTPASDFLGVCCKQWEDAAMQMQTLGIRTSCIRTGVVLSTQGGAMAKIAGLAKFGPAAAVGTGKQAMPWIHIDDICGIFIKALEDNSIHGAYNGVAPAHDDNMAFTHAIAKQIHRPVLPFPAPAFAIRLMYGEMSVVVLEGSFVSPQKVIDAGYKFKFTQLPQAIADLYSRGL